MRPKAAPLRAPAALVPLVAALASACGGGSEAPGPIDLAAGFEPGAPLGDALGWGAGFGVRADPSGPFVLVETRIEPHEWLATIWPGVWQVVRPLAGFEGVPARLRLGATELERVYLRELDPAAMERVPPGCFLPIRGNVFVRLAPGDRPTAPATLVVPIVRGESRDGRWRVELDRFGADGLSVWPGQREELVVSLPPGSRLTFATLLWPIATAEELGEVTFRVRLDGETLFEERRSEPGTRANARFHTVDLPADGRADARLAFEVEGPPAITAFACPTVVPPASRDADPRPDLVLFVADTFRADNMTTYGGALALTPNLDALADESVVFERAWSPATWTLPAHASLFTALYPHEHTVSGSASALPDDATTIAEVLARAGYRTGAITDGGYVSRRFGLDQGFAWFDEGKREMEETVDAVRRFLAAGDGRPTFLFVQTYRAHEPYIASAQARAALAERVSFGASFLPLQTRLEANPWDWKTGRPIPAEMRALLDQQRALYSGGVVDLDRGFGELLRALGDAGILEHGYLVVTSDHGEGFGEHDAIRHGTGLWEEQVRVPLLVHGPDLAARRVPFAALLNDVPHTLAALADAPPAPGWGGRSLLTLDADRPAYLFQCSIEEGATSARGVVEGDRKLMFPDEDGPPGAEDLLFAYDLAADPGEQRDRAEERWAAELAQRHATRLAELRSSRLPTARAELDPAAAAELKALGYVDGE